MEVRSVSKYPLTLISADYDVIEGAFVFDTWFAWHEIRIAKPLKKVNISCFKSDPIRPLDRKNNPSHKISLCDVK